MSALTFTLKQRPKNHVDLSPLTPDRLQGKSTKDLLAIQLAHGVGTLSVGDLFEVSGKDVNNIHVERSCDKLDGIGSGMTQGTIVVKGGAGSYLGRGMRGGRIHVKGSVGDWTGTGMSGGLIEILGNARDYVGSAYPAEMQSMKGGAILITGDAGQRIGDRMRRGTIAVQGGAGDFTGTGMLAGTVIVLGQAGDYTGYGMKRGTIVLNEEPRLLGSTFNDCGCFDLAFLRLVLNDVASLSDRFKGLRRLDTLSRRYAGDLAGGGKGEILILQGS
jgi:formylmethanofuran dehydrogenase subunit C